MKMNPRLLGSLIAGIIWTVVMCIYVGLSDTDHSLIVNISGIVVGGLVFTGLYYFVTGWFHRYLQRTAKKWGTKSKK